MRDRFQQAKKITLIGALINALLGVIKIVGGWVFHSHALIADGVHSFSDLLTDVMVVFASKFGSQDADVSHPYGHQRIETAATLLLSSLLILVGAGLGWDTFDEILRSEHEEPQWLALPIAAISIVANEALFHYTQRVGKRIQSDLIIANAWHHRSDAAASLVVVLGIVGSLCGYSYLDAIAAIIVSLLIIKMGITYGWNSVKELVDTAVGPEDLQTIETIVTQVKGVRKIHQLRSRSMGSDVFVDLHILVDPFISVSEGHFIAQHVHRCLLKKMKQIKDVTVHVDPEDDETSCPSFHLMDRETVFKGLVKQWQQDYPAIHAFTLHYLNGELRMDLVLLPSCQTIPDVMHRINQDLIAYPDIRQVILFVEQGQILSPC